MVLDFLLKNRVLAAQAASNLRFGWASDQWPMSDCHVLDINGFLSKWIFFRPHAHWGMSQSIQLSLSVRRWKPPKNLRLHQKPRKQLPDVYLSLSHKHWHLGGYLEDEFPPQRKPL